MEENNPIEVIKLLIQKIFNYLKEDKHLGAVTWITTVFTTLSVAILKFLKFVTETGKLKYWNINTSAISVSGDNILYDIIVTAIFAIVVFLLFLIPYFIIRSKVKKVKKTLFIFGIAIVLSIVLYFGSNAKEIIHNSPWVGIVAFLIADLFLNLVLFTPSIIFLIATKPYKKQSKPLTAKGTIILVIVIIFINVFYFYTIGFWSAKTETKYRITTDSQYAIVYETENVYYLAKYDESKNEIKKNQQKIISKEDVEYTWKSNIGVK